MKQLLSSILILIMCLSLSACTFFGQELPDGLDESEPLAQEVLEQEENELKYQEALALINSGYLENYNIAYELFKELGDYKASKEYLARLDASAENFLIEVRWEEYNSNGSIKDILLNAGRDYCNYSYACNFPYVTYSDDGEIMPPESARYFSQQDLTVHKVLTLIDIANGGYNFVWSSYAGMPTLTEKADNEMLSFLLEGLAFYDIPLDYDESCELRVFGDEAWNTAAIFIFDNNNNLNTVVYWDHILEEDGQDVLWSPRLYFFEYDESDNLIHAAEKQVYMKYGSFPERIRDLFSAELQYDENNNLASIHGECQGKMSLTLPAEIEAAFTLSNICDAEVTTDDAGNIIRMDISTDEGYYCTIDYEWYPYYNYLPDEYS